MNAVRQGHLLSLIHIFSKETAAMFVDYQNKGFSVGGMNVENYIEVLINE